MVDKVLAKAKSVRPAAGVLRGAWPWLLVIAAGILLLLADMAQARVYIDVTRPFSRKLPLALPAFYPMEGSAADPMGEEGRRVLNSDLSFTGVFEMLDPKGFLGNPAGGEVNYRQWSRVGAELLITGGLKVAGDGIAVEMRLHDVAGQKLLVGRRYDGVAADLPAMMHRFADEVMLAITGERSVFSSVIAFVGARQPEEGKPANKEIYLMNFDGSRARPLTDRRDISLYPSWSSDGKLLTYSSYVNRRPAAFVHALAGGGGRVAVNKPGVNLTPAFVPGRQELAVSMSHTGKTNIFLCGLGGEIIRQLTDGWGIDVAPTFSPDGKQMAYVSDRAGQPQLYVTDMNGGGGSRRLSFGFKYTASPCWSPRGDRIVFQAMIDGVFQVASVRPDGSDQQVLTSGHGGGEDPTWSPDGRLIAYANRSTGRYQIYVMTSNGQPIRRLTNLPGENTDPAWSPRGVAGN